MVDDQPESSRLDPSPSQAAASVPSVDDIRVQAETVCQEAGYETTRREPVLGEVPVLFAVPNGRYKRYTNINSYNAPLIVSKGLLPLVTAIGDYEAFLYRDTFEIEARLRMLTQYGPSAGLMMQRLPGVTPKEVSEVSSGENAEKLGEEEKSWVLSLAPDADQRWSAEISPSSARFAIFSASPLRQRTITLKISNSKVSNHDEALRALEQISDAILFEMDLRYGIPLSVSRLSPPDRRRRVSVDGKQSPYRRVAREMSTDPPHLPRNSYPSKPLALYWYARSAANMPLLQYLASYQVLEYYFSTYYQREIMDRMKQELLDPRFSPQNDSHLSRLLMLATSQGKGFGSEREQLRATVGACVSVSSLEEYLKEPARHEFFFGKQLIKDVTRLDLKSTTPDLRDQVSDRIYDIRCRIVHAKSDRGDRYPELLLPFSEEAEALTFDIALIQYLAQRILIHRAEPLRF